MCLWNKMNIFCQRGHDSVWSSFSDDSNSFCVACGLEFLEEQERPLVLKSNTVRKISDIMVRNSNAFIHCLTRRKETVPHFCATLVLAVHEIQSTEIIPPIIQCFDILAESFEPEMGYTLLNCVSTRCYSAQGSESLHPVLTLLKEVLVHETSLCHAILHDESFTKFVISNINFPDDHLRLVILQICVYLLISSAEESSSLGNTLHSLPSRLMSLMSKSDNTEILEACMEIICASSAADDFLSWLSSNMEEEDRINCPDEVLNLLKRVLLKRNERLTAKCVECIMFLLGRHGDAIREPLLKADLAEFIYDTLRSTTAYNLVSSVYCCILHLTESDSFHRNCHAMYGFESVLRSLQVLLKTPQSTVCAQGITLLRFILDEQPEYATILSTVSLFDRAMEVVKDGMRNKHPDVAIASAETASSLIKYFPPTFPTADITSLLETININMLPLVTILSGKKISQDSQELDDRELSIAVDESMNSRGTLLRKAFLAVWKVLYRCCEFLIAKKESDCENIELEETERAVLDAIEFSWLSATTKTLQALCSPTVIHSMLATIVFVCQHLVRFSIVKKLVTGVFIRLAMAAKSRFSNDERHRDSSELCTQFLFSITCAATHASLRNITDDWKVPLQNGFSDLQGRLSECLFYFEEQFSSLNSSSVQYAVIAMLFCLRWYEARVNIPRETMKSSLFRYFVLKSTLHDLPLITKKQLVFLYATCDDDLLETPDIPPALASVIMNCDTFVRHPSYISYILRLPSQNECYRNIQTSSVMKWLEDETDKKEDNIDINLEIDLLKQICKQNENVVFTVFGTLCDSCITPKLANRLVDVLYSACSYYRSNGPEEKLSAIYRRISMDLSKYAYERLASPESHLQLPFQTTFRLLLLITSPGVVEDLEIWSYLLRILKILLKRVAQNSKSDSEYVLPLIKLIVTCNERENQAKSVLAAIFSETNFVSKLKHWGFTDEDGFQAHDGRSGSAGASLSIEMLAILCSMQRQYDFPVQHTVIVKVSAISRMTRSRNAATRRHILELWQAVLQANFSLGFLQVDFETHSAGVENCRISISRVLFNVALNLTASFDQQAKETAFRYILDLMKYALKADDKELLQYLSHHPWLETVLTTALNDSNCSTAKNPELWVSHCMEIVQLRKAANNADESALAFCDRQTEATDDREDELLNLL